MTKEELAFIEWLKNASEKELRRAMDLEDKKIFREPLPSEKG